MTLLFVLAWLQPGERPHYDPKTETVVLPLESGSAERLQEAGERVLVQLMRIYLAPAPGPDESRPAIGGSYRVTGNELVFEPHFPFYPGHEHVIRVARGAPTGRADAGDLGYEDTPFRPPSATLAPRARVTAISPTGDSLPANLLRLYLFFSEPMSRHGARAHIRLVDAENEPVDGPFLDIGPALWDPSATRLTLLFDPGRIKRGLRPHLEKGPPLRPDQTYTLVVAAPLRDARGAPMIETFRTTFTTTKPDRTSPDWQQWRLVLPAPDSREPLTVVFDERLDVALAERLIHLSGPDGRAIEGVAHVSPDGLRRSLVPDHPWQVGEYTLVFDPGLEDQAGNRLDRLFDEEMTGSEPGVEAESVWLRRFTLVSE